MSFQFSANNAASYSIVSGALPSGLSLSSGGNLSGTPGATGGYSFTVRAMGSASNAVSDRGFSLTVNVAVVAVSRTGTLTEDFYSGYYGDNRAFFDSATKTRSPAQVSSINKPHEGDNYSYKWTGYVVPSSTGTYGFWTNSDDASHVYINNTLVVSNGGSHGMQTASGSIALTAGTSNPIEILFGQGGGGAGMQFQWYGGAQTSWTYDLSGIMTSGWSVTTVQPVIWMDGSSFANGTWTNKMGGAASASTGVAVSTQSGNANGCNSTFKYLYGGKGAGVELVNGWPTSGEHTFFHVTRYNNTSGQGRIWNAKNTNYLSGHWESKVGTHHDGRWAYGPFDVSPIDNWRLVTDQRVYARMNKGQYSGNDGAGAPNGFGINQYGGAHSNETSDWACAEVVVFSGNLSGSDMAAVENYLYSKYGFNYF
jgi:hypothetical protein